MDVDFYRYFIGREDQSVNEKVMISRIDQQINVNKIMVDEFDLWKIPNRKLRHYMFNYLEIITVISTIMLIRSGTEENLLKKRELWKYIKDGASVSFLTTQSQAGIMAYRRSVVLLLLKALKDTISKERLGSNQVKVEFR